ncbi:MAG: bifunctional phosphoribosylaminoimidazolecarboxamide formyltransferase/IMP cyclohydrolase [candidate division NC10 bacterium]|nr:bifunctional phosphoribosylaminoimidazolecarboxamide formyltransferase/IMP cyclohydrolase [candidate division NC10 bacterium]
MTRIRRALLSVSDKTGLVEFAAGLSARQVELVSTGGTAAVLRSANLPVMDVASVTGFPEMLDGRVKTLHPCIHGGLLALRGNPEHERELATHGIRPIDLVAVNLYPFAAAIAKAGISLPEAVEQIDIGGPALLRSAAKNFEAVAVVVHPADYGPLLDELSARDGSLSRTTRFALARKAFSHTAYYDGLIAAFMERVELEASGAGSPPTLALPAFPDTLFLRLEKLQELRYGENPHQRAALYRDLQDSSGLASARQLHGKELSYNNLLDLHAAWELVKEFAEPTLAIIKHTNPCGVATADTLLEAFQQARATDPVSAFGGILASNRTLDAPTAEAIAATFVEAIIAPAYAPEALDVLRGKKNLRLLELPPASLGQPADRAYEIRRVSGGFLLQEPDRLDLRPADLWVVTRRSPSPQEERGLRFAWRVAKHVKSNAIVLATERATVGVGAGQMSRVDAARLARQKAQGPPRDMVLASDAFFPFRDGVDVAAEAGVTAIIQPGGSVRDAEVIAAADEHGMAMLFTGVRHFRH